MQDGPAISWELAQLIHSAYIKLHGNSSTLQHLAGRGGFSWTEVSLIFRELRQKHSKDHNDMIEASRDPRAVKNWSYQLAQRQRRPGIPGVGIRTPRARQIISSRQPPAPIEQHQTPLMEDEKLMPLAVICWKWNHPTYRSKYTAEHVNVLANMVARHYPHPHRFVCITDDPTDVNCETLPIWSDGANLVNVSGAHLPSCYRRLKIFDPSISKSLGRRIVSLDLDVVIVRDVSSIWNRDDQFIGWQVPGFIHPKVFNGSMFLFQSGTHGWLWTEFKPDKSPQETKKAGYFGSDQGWLSYRLATLRPGWTERDGVYSYPRQVRTLGALPSDARIVIFHGKRKPWDEFNSRQASWISKHWR